ncbi:MAG: hypothetical protein J0I09_01785 [Sphingobacteriia bacterium]|nr:hypothetical protein [Sphingobacteriia bacterium]
MKKTFLLISPLLFFCVFLKAQSIIYSEPDRDDYKNMNYEVMGKLEGKVFIYKGIRDQHQLCIYDAEMKLVNKVKLDFINNNLINIEFIAYQDKFLVFYNYQNKNVIYSMAARIGANGKILGQPLVVDTTNYSSSVNNNIYTLAYSEDKSKIVVYKIRNKEENQHTLITLLFDKELSLLHRSSIIVPMPDKKDFLNRLVVDNDGDIALLREAGSNSNDNINKLALIIKPGNADSLQIMDIKLNNINLDDVKIKPDNINKRFLILSFYSKQKRGNVDGLFCFLWDKLNNKVILNNQITVPDDLRNEARSDGNLKSALNDFFLKNIIIKNDGGFVIATESVYMSTRGNNYYNRWDYLGYNSFWGVPGYYYGSGLMGGYYPWSNFNYYNTTTRYFADNIMLLSFDDKGKMDWSNVIHKSQYDDNADNFISYGIINTGEEIHFLYNVLEKRDWVITDQAVAPGGQLTRKPTFKNLDKGYDFMPRLAKQTGARQIIVPCMYRNLTCFAKIDF